MTTCAIVQPHYLPWIGYFEMIDRADVFVYLDDVQFVRREWKNRNRVRRSAHGEDCLWLTVPVHGEDHRAPLRDVRIAAGEDWPQRHLATFHHVYGHAPAFTDWFPVLEDILPSFRAGRLADLNIALTEAICGRLGISTRRLRSSELGASGKREERLAAICQAVGARRYLANDATAAYVPAGFFEGRGIVMEPQRYAHPIYGQSTRGRELPFLSHLSVVDLLFNSRQSPLRTIRSGRPSEAR